MDIFVVIVVADAVVDVDAGVNSVNIFKCIVRILLMILSFLLRDCRWWCILSHLPSHTSRSFLDRIERENNIKQRDTAPPSHNIAESNTCTEAGVI